MRRLATIGLYAGIPYVFLNLTLQYFDAEVELLDQEEAEESHNGALEDAKESDFANEDSLFIPMTWAKKMPRTYYKGSDPEWQEFIKIAKDRPRHKTIQDELLQVILSKVATNFQVFRMIGKDAKIGKYWLDIRFPDGPPPEFERSGIEIGDDFVAWSQQRITADNQFRWMRAVWPTAVFDALWATTKVLAGIKYRRAKQALGWEEKDPFSPEERYRHALEMMQKQQQNRESKEVGQAQMETDGNPGSVIGGSAAAGSQSRTSSSDANAKMPWLPQIPLPPTTGTSDTTDIAVATSVFRTKLMQRWSPKDSEPPKGTFVVEGLMELRGSVGRILYDVQSFYDPKESKFIDIRLKLRSHKRWNQGPRGGR